MSFILSHTTPFDLKMKKQSGLHWVTPASQGLVVPAWRREKREGNRRGHSWKSQGFRTEVSSWVTSLTCQISTTDRAASPRCQTHTRESLVIRLLEDLRRGPAKHRQTGDLQQRQRVRAQLSRKLHSHLNHTHWSCPGEGEEAKVWGRNRNKQKE